MTNARAPQLGASLDEWLHWIEAVHPNEIELGLTRATAVALKAKLLPVDIPIITVAGTNGKGSTVAMLDAMYQAAGYSTGVYTSPHIVRFNERICMTGKPASDAVIIKAFETIESVREDTQLTYFEFATLAAMHVFVHSQCDIILLEVGLGGRLDTTNVWDTDCAVVTSIAIDHESWLGSDREKIGAEKIGIGRSDVPLIMGDQDPPRSVLNAAIDAGMQLQRVPAESMRDPLTLSLPGQHQQSNAHAALLAVSALQNRLPVPLPVAKTAVADVRVPGRFEQQRIDGVLVVQDVAHNPAAAASVVAGFEERFPKSPVFAVFGALDDKDLTGVVKELNAVVRHWHCISLADARGTVASELCAAVTAVGGACTAHNSFAAALDAAYGRASAYNSTHPLPEAVVLVVGSFFTLTALHAHWKDVGRLSR